MAKKRKIVLHQGCFTVDTKRMIITRYYQDKKGGGFRDRIGGFKSKNELLDFVASNTK